MPSAAVPPSPPGDDASHLPGPATTPTSPAGVGGSPPIGHALVSSSPADGAAPGRGSVPVAGTSRRRTAWIVMATLVGLEFAVGLASLLLVPVGRPSGAFPHKGLAVYDLHGALGVALLVGALAVLAAARRGARMLRIAAWVGIAGICVAGAGGLLAAEHPWRVAGIALMFVGSLVAGFAYLVGTMEPQRPQPPAAPSPGR